MRHAMRTWGAAAMVVAAACGSADSEQSSVERIVRPDGRVEIRYGAASGAEPAVVEPNLRIGALDGGGPATFGSVRGLAVGDDGAIYVFDMQSSEVRVFEADGTYRTTLSRSGQGPGEISRGQGMALSPTGTLWINDSGNNAIIGLSPDAREVGRYPLMVAGYAFYWTGSIDSQGVFWEQWDHSIERTPFDITATGPVESTSRSYYKSFDPLTESYDSVDIGLNFSQGYRIAQADGSQTSMRIPYIPGRISTIDAEANIWTARSDEYAITKISASGDTLISITKEAPSIPVTQADLEAWVPSDSASGRAAAIWTDIARRIPKHMPVLTRLVSDDRGRLWVGRTVGSDEAPLFDVFSELGDYLGSVRIFRGLNAQLAPVIRNDGVYAVVTGEYGESYIVAGPLPTHLASGGP